MEMGGEVQFRRWFPATAESVPHARHWVADAAAATGHHNITSTLELLVSELTTNAVRHSGSAGFLIEFDANARVFVAVCDSSETVPQANLPDAAATGGRGLAIVQTLADAWGVELHHHDGKCVWFQIDEPDRPSR